MSRVRPSFFLCWIVKIDFRAYLKLRFVRSKFVSVRRLKLFESMFKWSQIIHTRTILRTKATTRVQQVKSKSHEFFVIEGRIRKSDFLGSVRCVTYCRLVPRPRTTINFLIRPKWKVYDWPSIDWNHRNSLRDRLSLKLSHRSTDKRILFIREQLWVSKIVRLSWRVKQVESKSYNIIHAEISAKDGGGGGGGFLSPQTQTFVIQAELTLFSQPRNQNLPIRSSGQV